MKVFDGKMIKGDLKLATKNTIPKRISTKTKACGDLTFTDHQKTVIAWIFGIVPCWSKVNSFEVP
jgi:hypothetical protein